MTLDELPTYAEIDAFTPDERKAIMIVREGKSEDAPVELAIRNLFVWAILTRASDVHVSGHGDRQKPAVHISVRTPKRLVNFDYREARGKHFEAKLFQLTATPQGGSTPDILSTRFAIELPARFARQHGLFPKQDARGRDRPYLVSIRVEYIRTYDGFAFVCRLLDQQRTPGLHELGLSYALLRAIRRAISEPSGLILVSGPTGSGKTTLLYAILDLLNTGQRAITTIENPVEYQLEVRGPTKQIEVRGEITFPRALRSTLRQDPEIILVGEIRDTATMEIAMQAAQTGHLVLATLHANSGPETLSRALDLTPDKHRDALRLAELVKFVIAQRLLDRFEGEVNDHPVAADEASWLQTNGLGFIKRLPRTDARTDARTDSHDSSITKIGKAALIEAFSMTADMKDAVRSGQLNSSDIYRFACEQPQYETLASAGVRAVQGLGCSIRDCMTGLESTSDAAQTPGLRARLAREHGLTLVQVADVVDAWCQAEDASADAATPIEAFIQPLVPKRAA